MKAYLKNYRQSPRKVRLVADLIRGKKVSDALVTLRFTPKKAAKAMRKLLESAAANAATNDSISSDALTVGTIQVDDGVTMKRFKPRSRGMANKIRKRTSNVLVELTPVQK